MSFGGSVSAMISSLKNNARPKRKTYFDRGYCGDKESKTRHPLLDKKATPEQLKTIRENLKKENKEQFLIQVFTMLIAISLILFFLLR